MHLKIECDDEGEQLLCELFAEMLENKWAAESAPHQPEPRKQVIVPHWPLRSGVDYKIY